VLSSHTDAGRAIEHGLELAAGSLGAEVVAFVDGGGVVGCVGYPRGGAPAAPLMRAAGEDSGSIELPDHGRCATLSAPAGEDDSGVLLIARAGEEPFTGDDADLLGGMAHVLGLTMRTTRLLRSLQERQSLLERLSVLQRSIASRAELSQVLDAIVDGAHELLGDETVGLRLISAEDPGEVELVASRGVSEHDLTAMRRSRLGEGAGGRAIAEGELIVVEDYEAEPSMVPQMISDGIRAALAAPVRQRGEVVGSLVVATHRPGRIYSPSEREALLAFAEHAGLALNDAKAAQETAHQAFHDPLTGLPNRALFLDRLRLAKARAQRSGHQVAVLFADLDGFKTVNDSLGHAAGDQLLVSVGQRFGATVRPSDTVARFGGDEFAILMEDVEEPIMAARIARRALEVLERPFEVLGREVFITASIGIAVGNEAAEDLLRNADLAMYEAKGRGKGRYELFQREMHRAMAERLELEQDLKRAVEDEEFVLHFQPLVELDTGRATGVEALVRWMHPEWGMIPPGDFIPLAEETGRIHAIGRWVLHRACHLAAGWQDDHGPLELSVNLSGAQLRQASLVREVSEALEESGLDPELLILEITESVLMDATASNVERLAALKRLGVRLAVDDYGTGYSSLQYLRRFPIDQLKIAKPFVDGVDRSAEEAGVARAIIDLGHSLNLSVVAEGIETKRQAERLYELGCPRGQGFFFSHPRPVEEVPEALERSGTTAGS
jgi:diguanylate cyclase (GGDEF)-like protein